MVNFIRPLPIECLGYTSWPHRSSKEIPPLLFYFISNISGLHLQATRENKYMQIIIVIHGTFVRYTNIGGPHSKMKCSAKYQYTLLLSVLDK